MARFDFQARDGTKLVGILEKSGKKNAPLVILCHELGQTKDGIQGSFVRLTEKLNDTGFDVFRFDFRGHGESAGKQQDVTVFGETLDLEAAFDACKKQGYSSIGILGASFGGATAASFLEMDHSEVKAVVLWYPLLDGTTLTEGKSSWSKKQITKSNFELLKAKGYILLGKDGFKLGSAAIDELRSFSVYSVFAKSDVPVLIIHGDVDNHVPYSDSVKATVASKYCSLEILEGVGHGFHEAKAGHEADRKTIEWFQTHVMKL